MAKLSAQQVYSLINTQIVGKTGNLTFSLANISLQICQTNIVGNILEEWLDKWMTNNNIDHVYNSAAQSSPDFWLDSNKSNGNWLEIKSFIKSPNFDLANFESYIDEIKDQPWKLEADYLIFEYSMDTSTGVIKIEKVWLKKIWEISCPCDKWAVKNQEKRGMIYNLRPATWYSNCTKYPSFSSKEDFLSALADMIDNYPHTAGKANDWLDKVVRSYNLHYGIQLQVPNWTSIKTRYNK